MKTPNNRRSTPTRSFAALRRLSIRTALGALCLAAFPFAPAQAEIIYGVTIFRDLITFDNAAPSNILSTTPITGLTGQNEFESVRHIDFRPATGQLYAVGNAPMGIGSPTGIYRLYTIDIDTGVASRVGGNLNPIGGSFGFNFDPTTDQIRIVTDDGKNLLYSPVSGSLVATESALAYKSGDPNFGENPKIVTGSYTNSVANAATTALYDIDAAKGTLVRQNPPIDGTLTTMGNLGIALPNYIDGVNLDIAPDSGVAYLAISDPGANPGKTRLYRVNLSNGAATDFGEIGSGLILNSISVPLPPPPALPHIASISKTGPSLPGGRVRFTAQTQPGLSVRVQSSTAANGNEGSWSDLPDGGRMTENHPSNPGAGKYTLITPSYPRIDGVFFRAISSKDGFTDGKSDRLGPFPLSVPQPPPHGGLSQTFLTVNESVFATGNVADTVLRFAAVQTGTPAELRVRVQATTTPNDELDPGWTDLPDGLNGQMTREPATSHFLLNSTNYPLQNGVYFRAIAYCSSYGDNISNVVGPINQNGFNLATNKPHLGAPLLFTTTNGHVADLDFLADLAAVPNGLSLRIQSTTTPGDETSWTNLNHSSQGQMERSTNPEIPNQFLLRVNNHPAAEDLFFRVVSSLSGSVDSISAPSGPFTLVPNTPPKVTITPTTKGLTGSGNGKSFNNPIIVSPGTTFLFGVTAESSRSIGSLSVQFNGLTFGELAPGAASGSGHYTTSVPGDYVLEAVAVDDLGATARAGTAPVYISVRPATTSNAAKAEPTATDGSAATQASGKTFIAVTDNGAWTESNTWRDSSSSKPGVPGPEDFAILGSTRVRFKTAGSFQVKALSINGGQLTGRSLLTVTGQTTIASASFVGAVTLLIERGAVCELVNPSTIQFNPDADGFRGIITNVGTLNIHGSAGIIGTERINNLGTINFQTPISLPPNPERNPAAGIRPIPVESSSALITSASKLLTNGRVTSVVTLVGLDGASLIGDGGGTIVAGGGGNLVGAGGSTLVGAGGSTLIGQDGAAIVAGGGGNLIDRRGGTSGSGIRQVRSSAASEGYTQSAGETNLNGIRILGPVTLNGGSLTGSGLIAGNVTNNGFILPGNSAGGISILGNYTQGAEGSLIIENGGPNAGQYDQLQVSGVATLGGKLQVRTIDGYVPDAADTFNPLGYKSVSGAFASISSNTKLSFKASGALARIDPKVANPPSPKALNISTRMRVETGDNALIAGFIVTGSQPKKVIIRGLGPSLPLSGAVADTTLSLDGGAIVNDDWRSTQQQAIKATGIPPTSDLESAIVATLAPGGHTAILRGKGDTTGVGLVEVYDLDSEAPAQLANISTRGLVQTGDNVMIGGFIIGGNSPAKVLLRAIGPSLPVAGALQDPVLDLVDKNGNTISNDNWRATQESEIASTGVPPSDGNEAAIVATLVPGGYTAIVRGFEGSTGIALVEGYILQ